jgi:hypothetical protein
MWKAQFLLSIAMLLIVNDALAEDGTTERLDALENAFRPWKRSFFMLQIPMP